MVKINFSSVIRQASNGDSSIELTSKGTVKEILSELIEHYGNNFESKVFQNGFPKRYINIYVNGTDIRHLKNLETNVGISDEVDLIPAVSGG
jgi:sulfur-carrier protein